MIPPASQATWILTQILQIQGAAWFQLDRNIWIFQNRKVWERDVCLSWGKIKGGTRASYSYLKFSYKDYRGRLFSVGPGSPDMGQEPPECRRFRLDMRRMAVQTGNRLVREQRLQSHRPWRFLRLYKAKSCLRWAGVRVSRSLRRRLDQLPCSMCQEQVKKRTYWGIQ